MVDMLTSDSFFGFALLKDLGDDLSQSFNLSWRENMEKLNESLVNESLVNESLVNESLMNESLVEMNSTTMNYTRGPREQFYARIVVGILELLVFVIGAPANYLVLYMTYDIFRKRGRGQNGENGQFQHGQWFVLTMTSFDLLFCLVHSPLMFVMLVLIERVQLNYSSCIIMYFATYASTTGSSLSLLALNIEKFIRLYKPLHYRSLMTKWRTVTACISVWIVSASWAVFLAFGPFMTNDISPRGQCQQTLNNPGIIYTWFTSQFFVVPTFVSLAISVFTLLAALKIRRHRQATVLDEIIIMRHVNPRCKSASVKDSGCQEWRNRKKNDRVSLMKLVGFVFTTTVWTSITTLPYRLGYLWVTTNPASKTPTAIANLFLLFGVLILNAAGNPFITIITKRQYSIRARHLFSNIVNGICGNSKLARSETTTTRLEKATPSEKRKLRSSVKEI